jgi:integrase
MSEKRRDNKKRILRTGESQRSDGRYVYKYKGSDGKPQFVYAWKLVETDITPAGKRENLSLREKENEIDKKFHQGLETSRSSQKATVGDFVEKFLALKSAAKIGTYRNYVYSANNVKKTNLWNRKISTIKKSDAKEYIVSYSSQRKSGTTQGQKSFMKKVFQLAVDDRIISNNPFDFEIKDVLSSDDVTEKVPLTEKEESDFMNFIKDSSKYSKYYNAMYVLFNTGLRVSELSGLTVSDIHLEERYINVERQINLDKDFRPIIVQPKTKKGTRRVPIGDALVDVLTEIIDDVREDGPNVDGLEGFLFTTNQNKVTYRGIWTVRFKSMQDAYNRVHPEHPIKLTPHICRHTYCTRMAMAGMNLKVLQKIMGHTDLDVTLRVYTNANFDDILSEMNKIESSKNRVPKIYLAS